MDHNPYLAPTAPVSVDDEDDTCTKMYFFSWGQRIGRVRCLAYTVGLYALFGALFAFFDFLSALGKNNSIAVFSIILYIALLIGLFTVAVRRLHDLDHSGFVSIVLLIPIINLLLSLYMLLFPGTPGINDYGKRPLPNTAATWIAGAVLPIGFIILMATAAIPAYQDYQLRMQYIEEARSRAR